jgi:hypothetical protein
MYKTAHFICLLILVNQVKSQSFLDAYQKDISISLGTLTSIGQLDETEFGGVFYRSFAPSLHVNVLFAKSNNQGLSIGLDLAQFWNVSEDTITLPSSDNDYFFKAFDFYGQVQFGAINASWDRFFGQNEKCNPFLKVGGEMMMKRAAIFRGQVISSEFEGVQDFFYPLIYEFSFNGRIGFGLKHQLSKRVKIFEVVNASYMLFTRKVTPENNWFFSPLLNNQYLLLNMSVGITFSLDQE